MTTHVLTENGALALPSTGDAVVDYFVRGTIRGVPPETVSSLVRAAWNADKELLLRAIRNARDCRSGKGERRASFLALVVLRAFCAMTYRANMERLFASDGRYKDLLEVAALVEGDTAEPRGAGKKDRRAQDRSIPRLRAEPEPERKRRRVSEGKAKGEAEGEAEGEPLPSALARMGLPPAVGPFWELQLLARELAADVMRLERGERGVTLAAKWAPSPGDSLDRRHRFAGRVAKILFGPGSVGMPEGWAATRDALVARTPGGRPVEVYRKRVLAPLREHLRVVERAMSSGEWGAIDYASVPAKAMRQYRQAFQRRDEGRFREFLDDVRAGRATVKTAGLAPDELVSPYLGGSKGAEDEVLEAQWRELVATARAKGGLAGTVPVVDVSGSMSGKPMEAAIALGLIACLLPGEADPFHRKVVTFHEEPRFFDVRGESLRDMVAEVARAPWGGSTDLVKVYRVVLDCALRAGLPQDRLPSTVLVLTDMQFDEAQRCGHQPATVHETIGAMYREAGYVPPRMVYWNLRASEAALPVAGDVPGAAYLSGYSHHLLGALMEEGEMTPVAVMRRVLDKYTVEVAAEDRDRVLDECSEDRGGSSTSLPMEAD